MRVTGDEPQGTMGRVQTAYIFIERETSGYEAVLRPFPHASGDLFSPF